MSKQEIKRNLEQIRDSKNELFNIILLIKEELRSDQIPNELKEKIEKIVSELIKGGHATEAIAQSKISLAAAPPGRPFQMIVERPRGQYESGINIKDLIEGAENRYKKEIESKKYENNENAKKLFGWISKSINLLKTMDFLKDKIGELIQHIH